MLMIFERMFLALLRYPLGKSSVGCCVDGGMLMDISIRNVDASALKIIDDRAKKLGESRNAYLTRLIEVEARSSLFHQERERNRKELDRVSKSIGIIAEQLNSIEQSQMSLLMLMSIFTGIELEELDQVMKGELHNE